MRRVFQLGFLTIARACRIPVDQRRSHFLRSSIIFIDTVFLAPGIEKSVDLLEVV